MFQVWECANGKTRRLLAWLHEIKNVAPRGKAIYKDCSTWCIIAQRQWYWWHWYNCQVWWNDCQVWWNEYHFCIVKHWLTFFFSAMINWTHNEACSEPFQLRFLHRIQTVCICLYGDAFRDFLALHVALDFASHAIIDNLHLALITWPTLYTELLFAALRPHL